MNYSKEDLDKAIKSAFIFDDQVNDTIQKNVSIGIRKLESEDELELDEKRYDLYPLQFMWIPMVLDQLDNNYEVRGLLLDLEFWKKSIMEMGFERFGFDWKDIKAEIYSMNENLEVVVYEFPFTEREGLAVLGLVVIDKTGKYPYKYYTMELPGDDYIDEDGQIREWFVCSQTGDEHENYGSFALSSLDDFIKVVLSYYPDLYSSE